MQADTVFAVQGEREAVLLLVQLNVTLFHGLLQRGNRPEYGLHTLTHTDEHKKGKHVYKQGDRMLAYVHMHRNILLLTQISSYS